ncbi:MAG: pirin family protein [Bryobacteraceae bacterium]
MITIRPADQRGHANHGWLDTRFSFSFAEYYDPAHMGFRALRVINDDRIAAGAGFPMHSHRDMEIITYMLDGAIAHRDSMGNEAEIREGEVQRMTAGSGVMHSEFNPLKEGKTRLLQIWLRPRERGLTPGYEQRMFTPEEKANRLLLMASADGRDGSMRIEQDADLYASVLAPGSAVEHRLAPGRHAWLQTARGSLTVNGQTLREGDGAAVSDEGALAIESGEGAEILLFDLA